MKKLNIPVLLIVISSFFYNGCISFMATKNQFSGFQKDKINKVDVYYSEPSNEIGMQIDGKIKTLGKKGNYYLTFNLDSLRPEVMSTLNYDSLDAYKYAYILQLRKNEDEASRINAHTIEFYRNALEKGKFDNNNFILLYSANKNEIDKLENQYRKKMLAEFPLNSDQEKEIENLNIYLLKEQRKAWWKNLFLIVTIPLDLATLPIQVVVALIIIK